MSINKESEVRVLCSTVSRCEGRQVSIQGWVHGVRHLGQVAFMDVRDRSGIVQCVLEGKGLDLSLTLESVVAVHGRAVPAAKAANGIEIHVDRVEVLNRAASPLPFDLNKKHLKVRLPGAVPVRHAAAWRLRHRAGAAYLAPARPRQCAGSFRLPAGSQPAGAVMQEGTKAKGFRYGSPLYALTATRLQQEACRSGNWLPSVRPRAASSIRGIRRESRGLDLRYAIFAVTAFPARAETRTCRTRSKFL
ncbi:OB-fold nucleic acid binding domain-containing protein [Paenibacillus melissococcoides]|uniref:OB-fold nucleic acid binding domain-containing protein n=1 Tax=Paenibacillus melissococcoides TaxID=2912268 RepID=A0ABN8UB99_9BACL|nr:MULTISPECIES: OB-fold nucleic acid binding domain-containing protein [Paenibacillus]MEB9892139.1 OB-fold nucleic acid binding domain-containing protein [Bacillus cereus]CAH8246749.1 OB-fold nucleic acid binding domain-containing protein [Paenibacillus melissococcoides]CAH8715640.1 OB-fold nucleic acid binding domain-containing protein [Paenibacillus melissococcoides]CAH8716599.1 OB-fold nucleic acid binding domain-containing protein [Paenibacillus melissococcoides]